MEAKLSPKTSHKAIGIPMPSLHEFNMEQKQEKFKLPYNLNLLKTLIKKILLQKNNKGPLYSFKPWIFSSPTGLPGCLIRNQYIRVIPCCVYHHYLYEMALTLALWDNGIPCPQIKQSKLTTAESEKFVSGMLVFRVLCSFAKLPTSTPKAFRNSAVCLYSLANEK